MRDRYRERERQSERDKKRDRHKGRERPAKHTYTPNTYRLTRTLLHPRLLHHQSKSVLVLLAAWL